MKLKEKTPNLAFHNIVIFMMFSQIGIKIDPSEPEILYFVLPTHFMATCPIVVEIFLAK